MALSCAIENDGSLTVYKRASCLIRNMYPGIDGHSIHTFHFFLMADTETDGFYQAAEGMGGDTGYYGKDSS